VNLLAIETATDMVGVALIRGDGGAAERVHVGGRAHAELLAPAIEEVCAVSGCAIGDIGGIAVDVGPGLFTGLRVGVATAKALAQALSLGVLGVGSLDVLAAAARDRIGADVGAQVLSVIDARRGEVFMASYRFDRIGAGVGAATESAEAGPAGADEPIDPELVRHDWAQPVAPEALVAWLADRAPGGGRISVVGDGAVRYRELLAADDRVDLRWADELAAPPPLALAHLARARLARGVRPAPAGDLLPDYRRAADARINWEQRAPQVPAPSTPRGTR
jgi:tRNA threonylcarbamoyladenosine biosynthesis protein TsaB